MTTLKHLADEICVGLRIYVSGRSGRHLKTAFVLCDDYTELATKLFLIQDNPKWSDTKANGRWKSYHDVLEDLIKVVAANRPATKDEIAALHSAMEARRKRRNVFFHSTTLLDLQTSRKDTAEALTHLLDYCELLFGDAWEQAVAETAELELLSLMVRVDNATSKDATLLYQLNAIFAKQKKNVANRQKTGVHVTVFPEDLHALLCATWGGHELIADLKALL